MAVNSFLMSNFFQDCGAFPIGTSVLQARFDFTDVLFGVYHVKKSPMTKDLLDVYRFVAASNWG